MVVCGFTVSDCQNVFSPSHVSGHILYVVDCKRATALPQLCELVFHRAMGISEDG